MRDADTSSALGVCRTVYSVAPVATCTSCTLAPYVIACNKRNMSRRHAIIRAQHSALGSGGRHLLHEDSKQKHITDAAICRGAAHLALERLAVLVEVLQLQLGSCHQGLDACPLLGR
jgi:hypothetical protein